MGEYNPAFINSWCRPTHNRHRADAVLRAARDNPIAVGNVDQNIALAVEEAHDLQCLENHAAVFVEDALAVLEFAENLDRAYLTAGNAGVTGILRHAHSAFHAPGLCPGKVTGDTLDLRVVEAVDHDFIVGAEPSKIRADRAGRPAFGTAGDPPTEEHDYQKNSCTNYYCDPFHDDSPSWGKSVPDPAVI